MRLRVTHLTRFSYSDPVTEEVVECRLGPLWDDTQRWQRFELRVKPSGHIRTYLDPFDYLRPSRLIPADPRLEKLAGPHRPSDPQGEFDAARALTELVHGIFEYIPDATDTSTTLADALDQRTGVCQ